MIKRARSRLTQVGPLIRGSSLKEEMWQRKITPRNYYEDNRKGIKQRREKFNKKQLEFERIHRESTWKMKEFRNIKSIATKTKKELEYIKKVQSEQKEKEKKKVEAQLKTINESDYIRKNIYQIKVTKPEEKIVEKVQNLELGRIPK